MRRRVLIKGRVHGVGYRPFLLGLVEFLEIERFYAENIHIDGVETVEVLVDADEEKVEKLIELIHERRPAGAEVKEIIVEDYGRRVMPIESYYRYLTAAQLSKIIEYGRKMVEREDLMLGKQDETIREIRDLRIDLRSFMEERLARIEREIAEIKARLGMA